MLASEEVEGAVCCGPRLALAAGEWQPRGAAPYSGRGAADRSRVQAIMGTTAILVGLLVAVLAATCWYAGEAGAAYVAVPTKIGTMLALLALAVLLGARDSASGTALLVGLALSLVCLLYSSRCV